MDKIVHSRKKRVLSQALSDSAMKSMEDNTLIVVRRFCDRLAEYSAANDKKDVSPDRGPHWTPAKNIANWSNYFSFDVMGILVFGKSFNMLDVEDNRYILALIQDGTQGISAIAHMPRLPKLHLTEIIPNRLGTGMKKFKAYSKAQSDDRIRNDAKTGRGFSKDELLSEASVLISAGSDTTSTAIAATIFYLLHNPVTLRILTDEIRSTFDTVEAIRSGAELNSCRYLRACIDEAMRCSPPVRGLMPREALAGGVSVNGYHFPAGVEVGIPHYAVHHHEAYFPDPFEFKP
ncbi:hypothetical protein MMC17_008909 [Xylographa soralifera]|nr:hypothetical protein [Xylographa soralifera]